jgi:hypothetical protein
MRGLASLLHSGHGPVAQSTRATWETVFLRSAGEFWLDEQMRNWCLSSRVRWSWPPPPSGDSLTPWNWRKGGESDWRGVAVPSSQREGRVTGVKTKVCDQWMDPGQLGTPDEDFRLRAPPGVKQRGGVHERGEERPR